MPKLLVRIVLLLLVPCLIGDPALAGCGNRNPGTVISAPFTQQAFASRAIQVLGFITGENASEQTPKIQTIAQILKAHLYLHSPLVPIGVAFLRDNSLRMGESNPVKNPIEPSMDRDAQIRIAFSQFLHAHRKAVLTTRLLWPIFKFLRKWVPFGPSLWWHFLRHLSPFKFGEAVVEGMDSEYRLRTLLDSVGEEHERLEEISLIRQDILADPMRQASLDILHAMAWADPSVFVKTEAIKALEEIASPASMEHLLALRSGREHLLVRTAAAHALAHIQMNRRGDTKTSTPGFNLLPFILVIVGGGLAHAGMIFPDQAHHVFISIWHGLKNPTWLVLLPIAGTVFSRRGLFDFLIPNSRLLAPPRPLVTQIPQAA